MHTCPTCHGTKRYQVLANHGPNIGCIVETRDCHTCNSFGEISDEDAARIDRGRVLRSIRQANGELLRDSAERNGMKVTELCSVEFGRCDPPPGFEP